MCSNSTSEEPFPNKTNHLMTNQSGSQTNIVLETVVTGPNQRKLFDDKISKMVHCSDEKEEAEIGDGYDILNADGGRGSAKVVLVLSPISLCACQLTWLSSGVVEKSNKERVSGLGQLNTLPDLPNDMPCFTSDFVHVSAQLRDNKSQCSNVTIKNEASISTSSDLDGHGDVIPSSLATTKLSRQSASSMLTSPSHNAMQNATSFEPNKLSPSSLKAKSTSKSQLNCYDHIIPPTTHIAPPPLVEPNINSSPNAFPLFSTGPMTKRMKVELLNSIGIPT